MQKTVCITKINIFHFHMVKYLFFLTMSILKQETLTNWSESQELLTQEKFDKNTNHLQQNPQPKLVIPEMPLNIFSSI